MNFAINAPDYTHRSFGIRALYLLNSILNDLGHKSRIIVRGSEFICNDSEIAIYPEIVVGNPLKAKKVIRYCLNHPGMIGGETKYDPSELVFYYDDAFKESAEKAIGHELTDRKLLLVPLETELFFNDGKPKSGALFYQGRGEYLEAPEAVVVIKKEWPETREQLAALMREARVLYCCDKVTAIILEARACGCKVLLAKNGQWVLYNPDDSYYFPPIQDNTEQVKHFLSIVEKAFDGR